MGAFPCCPSVYLHLSSDLAFKGRHQHFSSLLLLSLLPPRCSSESVKSADHEEETVAEETLAAKLSNGRLWSALLWEVFGQGEGGVERWDGRDMIGTSAQGNWHVYCKVQLTATDLSFTLVFTLLP